MKSNLPRLWIPAALIRRRANLGLQITESDSIQCLLEGETTRICSRFNEPNFTHFAINYGTALMAGARLLVPWFMSRKIESRCQVEARHELKFSIALDFN